MSQNQNIQSGLIEFLKNHSQSNETEFSGGRISTFSAKLGNEPITFNFKKLPDTEISNILKFSKVVPSLPKNYSGVTQNYIYVYLDPFKPAPTSQGFLYKLPYAINGASELRFGYEPFYIGKGVSPTGHRFNQHLANFLNHEPDNLENKEKQERFRSIGKKFFAASGEQPRTWTEYKDNWIKILFEFPNRETLERMEKVLINTIGSTSGIKPGPLVNILSTKN